MPPVVDYEIATEMFAKGASVRQVALHFNVSTQAIYYAINLGLIERQPAPAPVPATE